MRIHVFRFMTGLACCFCLLTISLGDDALSGNASRLAGLTLTVIDVLVEHHIASPPRQELVRHAVSVLRAEAKLDAPHGIGRQLSGITESADFRALLTQEWASALSQQSEKQQIREAEELFQSVVWSLLRMCPGRNMLARVQDHKADRQLAANRYVGTGIQLAGARDGKPPVMVKVFPGGPAHEVGAIDGDKILEIDGTTTDAMPLVEVVRLLRGPGGSDVEVLLQQNEDEPRRYTITRGVVPIKHTHSERSEYDGKSVEIIRFDRLTSATVSDLRKIEQEWESPPDAVLLDLQFSAVDLHQAVLLADALLDGGTIGRLVTTAGSRDFEASREALFAGIPMFVLISNQTDGTAEWIAAALQDQGRAMLVGEQTPGQPYISEPFDIPRIDWVLTLASGVLMRADGRSLLRPILQSHVPVAALAPTHERRLLPEEQVQHEGGVVPDHPIKRSGTAAPRGSAGRFRLMQPFNASEALPVIRPLLDGGPDEHQEVD